MREKAIKEFERLLNIMDELREKCPWDKIQTKETLRSLTLEECYELTDAIIENRSDEIKKELGDILLHIVFYAKIGSESMGFDMADVLKSLNDKLVYRHPHIYGTESVNDAKEVLENWEQLKLKEKDGNKTVLSGVPKSLPSIIKAHRIQDKARGVGFDWEHREQVWDKVAEEFEELKVEVKKEDKDKMEGEFGDLLFSIINAARLYDIDPDSALERTNLKFINRFNYLEQKTIKQNISLKSLSLDEMNVIWEEAKRVEREK